MLTGHFLLLLRTTKNLDLEFITNISDYQTQLTLSGILSKAELKEEITLIKKEIDKIESNQEEVDYFYDTIDYIIPYYDIIENKVEKEKKTVKISDLKSI